MKTLLIVMMFSWNVLSVTANETEQTEDMGRVSKQEGK